MGLKKHILKILKAVNRLMPAGCIVSFSSIPDFSDNAFAFFDYFCHEQSVEHYKLVWHVSDKRKISFVLDYVKTMCPRCDVKVVYGRSFKSVYYFMRSFLLVSTHGFWNDIFISGKQIRLLLWHGMPLKRIGYMNEKDSATGVITGDIYSVTSPFFAEQFRHCFHADREQVLIYGQPRTDLFSGADKKRVREILGIKEEHIVIFMPTFRKSKMGLIRQEGEYADDSLFSLSLDEWCRMDAALEDIGGCMAVKPHPLEDVKNIGFLAGKHHIRVIEDDALLNVHVQLYQFLAATDALITDFSSVAIDYLLLDKPICFFIPDMKQYEKDRGFLLDNIHQYLQAGGIVCETYNQLEDFVRSKEDGHRESRKRLNAEWNTFCHGESSKNILNYLSSKNLLSIRR